MRVAVRIVGEVVVSGGLVDRVRVPARVRRRRRAGFGPVSFSSPLLRLPSLGEKRGISERSCPALHPHALDPPVLTFWNQICTRRADMPISSPTSSRVSVEGNLVCERATAVSVRRDGRMWGLCSV